MIFGVLFLGKIESLLYLLLREYVQMSYYLFDDMSYRVLYSYYLDHGIRATT